MHFSVTNRFMYYAYLTIGFSCLGLLFYYTILEQKHNLFLLKCEYVSTKTNSVVLLEDVLVPVVNLTKDKLNIFFIETSCSTSHAENVAGTSTRKNLVLNARQACAIESTASVNPLRKIYLIYTCPVNQSVLEETPQEIIQIFSYKNVKIVHVNLSDYFKGSPVEEMFKNGTLETSIYPLPHASDVMRLLTLWKYGGTYLDLDVISIKSFDDLGTNFVGYESEIKIANGVLNFEAEGVGLNLLTEMLEHLNDHFSGNDWSSNGPDLVTNTFKRICVEIKLKEEKHTCQEFTIYQPKIFFPVRWEDWRFFFQEKSTIVADILKSSYIVHFWNKMSANANITVGSNQAYDKLAQKFCPLTHSRLKGYW